MEEYIYSVGIDIGTSTTQIIFSKMLINNVSGFGCVPKVEIVSKEVIYKSPIYFTPLLSEEEIDGEKVREIIEAEYIKSKIYREDLTSGAVIITGETSRKRNARDVVNAISNIAGDFVVATAGPDLESILAGKGSGASRLSEEKNRIVANLDIGGGTTNICYFKNGEVIDTACLDIGGRILKVHNNKITYISKKLQKLMSNYNLNLKVGDEINNRISTYISKELSRILEEAVGLTNKSDDLDLMITNHGITCESKADIFTFSGGVADCIYNEEIEGYPYDDIGVFLGKGIRNTKFFKNGKVEKANETMRATVIGAGNYSMNVSGSTIEYRNCNFPYRNIPVIKITLEKSEDICELHRNISKSIKKYCEDEITQIAISFKGLPCPSYIEIKEIAKEIVLGVQCNLNKNRTLIIVVETDISKALGQAIKRIIGKDEALLCIDGISCNTGDYIDIGEPMANGSIVPVVVKTLIFSN